MVHDSRLSRRKALGAGIGLSIPFVFGKQVFSRDSPNDRLRLGLIGCGMRGKYLTSNLPPDAQIVSLCDCSLSQIDTVRNPTGDFRKLLAGFVENDAARCTTYQDYRIMLDREKLDAVIITTPDHHHALPMMLACERGMDVYVEKPLSLTIAEGRAMVRMAERHKRVVQVGSQQRTMRTNRRGCEFIRNGGLGKVHLVQLRNYPGPMRYESLRPDPPRRSAPSDLDWDLFCGPTELRKYDKDLWIKDAYRYGFLAWRGWDLFRSFSGHLTTNLGRSRSGHDSVRAGDGTRPGPVKVSLRKDELDKSIDDMWHDKTPPLGTLPDEREDKLRFAPVSMWYASGTEVRFEPGIRNIVFHGERGKLSMSRNTYRAEPADLLPPPDEQEQAIWDGEGNVARPHIENWLSCVRSRDVTNAPIESGHRTATMCHLANIARELDSTLTWDPAAEKFASGKANQLLSRERRKGFRIANVVRNACLRTTNSVVRSPKQIGRQQKHNRRPVRSYTPTGKSPTSNCRSLVSSRPESEGTASPAQRTPAS